MAKKEKRIREPIVGLLGHVDHGKTTLLDYIRKTSLALKEPGRITQDIGATNVSVNVIKEVCGKLFDALREKIEIPGLLFIDTPGHEAFSSLREKGGSLSDLAVLVIDVNEGMKRQTFESLEILRKFKTPFVVAATKIDKLYGWLSREKDFIENFKLQNDFAKEEFESRINTIIAQLLEQGFEAELFYKVTDFTRQVAIVPCSGITGEGIPNLFILLIGLAQKYLKGKLYLSENARGIILEVKKDKIFGTSIDVILYDGVLRVGDNIVIGAREPIITKVRSILMPARVMDIRAEKKFKNLSEVMAAAGIKILAKDLEKAIPGAFLGTFRTEEEKNRIIEEVKKELVDLEIEEKREGIILRANNIGALEALVTLFTDRAKIKRAKLGPPTKEDIMELDSLSDELLKVLILFGVEADEEILRLAASKGIKVISSNIIYHLTEEFDKWIERKKAEKEAKKRQSLPKIGKIRILPGCIFRNSNPAIVGVEVLEGEICPEMELMDVEGRVLTKIRQIQSMGKNLKEAKKGEQVAISLPNVMVGRQIKEKDVLYTFITKEQYRTLKNELEKEEEKALLEEIRSILGYI